MPMESAHSPVEVVGAGIGNRGVRRLGRIDMRRRGRSGVRNNSRDPMTGSHDGSILGHVSWHLGPPHTPKSELQLQ